MEIDGCNTTKRPFKLDWGHLLPSSTGEDDNTAKRPLKLDWGHLLPSSPGKDDNTTKRPFKLDWGHLLASSPGEDDRPPEIITKSNKKSKKKHQAEDLEMVLKSDHEIEETIVRCQRSINDAKLMAKLPDGGERMRASFKRHKDELKRRRDCQLKNKVDNEGKEMIQVSDSHDGVSHGKKQGDRPAEIITTKRPLILDWSGLLPLSTGDDDRPQEIITTSNKKSIKKHQAEDLEMVLKSDHEIEETIVRCQRSINDAKLMAKLPDGGERMRASFKRHKDELKRRRDCQLANKVDNEGVSRGKKQGGKSLSSPSFDKLLMKKWDEPEDSKDSRDVNAFEKNLFYIKPYNGRRQKPKNQVAGKGRSRMAVSSSSQEPSRYSKSCLVDSEKQMTSNDDKSTSSFSVPNSPQGPPSSNLRPRTLRNGGKWLRANLKRPQDELQRRQLLVKVDNECEEKLQVSDDDAEHTSVHNHHRMEIDGCKQKGLTLLTLDRNKLLPLSTNRPPQIIMTSKKNPKELLENSYQTDQDLELVVKSDRELNETIAKLRANLKRHQDELQRRQLNAVCLAEADNLSILAAAAAAAENC